MVRGRDLLGVQDSNGWSTFLPLALFLLYQCLMHLKQDFVLYPDGGQLLLLLLVERGQLQLQLCIGLGVVALLWILPRVVITEHQLPP